ncbi:PKD domain-containing protein [Candidatus Bathyarchaeota archaeon]|nr:MAG: PKD domain-containing protein [Candidatus Bathyarchaeota archaeon]
MTRNSRMRRFFLVSLLLALLPLSFSITGNPVYVARANPSTLTVPGQYPTIGEAINAAGPGDTIQVSSGTYLENLNISKSLNLIGASPATTIIDGSGLGSGINITAANAVYVSGFTVRNSGSFDSAILVFSSTNITISGNTVTASSATNGTYLVNTDSSTVKGNTFTGNLYGVTVFGGFGNLIQGNNATGNLAGDISIGSSSGNRVVDNTIRGSQWGLTLRDGAVGTIVARNVIANHTSRGIFLWNSPSAGNLFFDNRIEFNRYDANTEGVIIQNSTLNRFYHNNIENNAIQVFGTSPTDIGSNSWDNATGSALNSSDIVIASANRLAPPSGTLLRSDPRIEFVDPNNDNKWERGEPVVFDSDNNNVFDASETAISAVGGNYWSSYAGLDNGSHGFTGDGIGDTMIPTPCSTAGRPCSVAGPAGVDWYPLMARWTPHGLNVTLSAKPLGGYPPLRVSLSGSAIGGLLPYSYSWSFGDGSISSQQNATHTYSIKGVYIATLTVIDASTVSGSNEISITVLAPVGSLNLRVLDTNLHPIPQANVTLTRTPLGQQKLSSLTNSLGTAGLTGLRAGGYTVQASSPGYETAMKNVAVVVGQTTNDQLVLAKVPPANSFPWALAGAAIATAIGALLLSVVVFKRRRKLDRASSHSTH